MLQQRHNKKAFTLVEMLIAVSVLSLLLASAYGLYSHAQKSFNVGSWRLSKQRSAQTFLLRLKETLEKANHAYSIENSGVQGRVGGSRNILIDTKYYNKLASTSNKLMLCGSINKYYTSGSPELRVPARPGIWKGFALQCFNKKLKLYQTGKWDDMEPSPPAIVGTADATKFVLDNTTGDFKMELEDVDSIGFWAATATGTDTLPNPEVLITCTIKLVKPKDKTALTESITAKISDRVLSEVVKQNLAATTR